MKIAYLYAGQGSQHPGMGKDLYEIYPAFRAAFDAGELDFDRKTMCFEEQDGLLNQTRYTQPCMVAFAVGMTAVLADQGIHPDVVAGLSLGEYSALAAAGVFTPAQAIEIASFRGNAMTQASAGMESAMTAVLKLDEDKLKACCEQATREMSICKEDTCISPLVQICNYNCPGQLVIGGEAKAVARASELAKEAGAMKCLPLSVSGPFHTPYMAPAGAALEEKFREMCFGEMKIPVLFNCLGDEKKKEDTIPALLVRQVQSGVRMEQIIRRLPELGVDTIIEIGPGKALTGFVRKTLGKAVTCYTVETVEDVEKIAGILVSKA